MINNIHKSFFVDFTEISKRMGELWQETSDSEKMVSNVHQHAAFGLKNDILCTLVMPQNIILYQKVFISYAYKGFNAIISLNCFNKI